MLLNGCATISYDYPRTTSSAIYLPEQTDLGKRIQPYVVKHRGTSGFYLISSGLEALLARVLLIDAAEKTLDLQYYIFRDDLTGKFMLDRILAAAARGVRVRLLLDDWRQTAAMDWWLTMMEIYPNIEVRVFNPFGGLRSFPLARPFQAVFGPERLRARMHNKAFIADNSVAIVGGRNIADEYFGASSDVYLRDLDIMALGPISQKVSAAFDNYWNCVLAIPLKALVSHRPIVDDLNRARHDLKIERESLKNSIYGIEMRESDFLKRAEAGTLPLVWAPAEVLADDPFKVIKPEAKMAQQLRDFLESAQSEILMISPYLVPGQAGVRWFKKMRDRGVTVKIVTNSLASTDAQVAQFGYMRYRKDLLRLGVQLYEMRPTPGPRRDGEPPGKERHFRVGSSSRGALHAKLLVLDRRTVFVGSFNFDPRSERFDTQNGIVIHSPQLAEQAAGLFDRDASPGHSYRVTLMNGNGLVWITEKDGREVRDYSEPGIGFWGGFSGRFLYLLLPESVL
ncbi:MAG: phospholipase D family protein [Syntrophales bacterium]